VLASVKMERTICNSTDMIKIKTALKEDDFCHAMLELGFELFGYEEDYPDDYYFMAKDNSLIVFVSMVNAVFYTYPKHNRGELL